MPFYGTTVSESSSLSSTHHANYNRADSNGFRFLILFITTLCLTSICSNMAAFNVTMICKDVELSQLTDEELTRRNSILLWAVSVGSILATMPFNWLYSKYGAKWVFFGAGKLVRNFHYVFRCDINCEYCASTNSE